MTSVKALLALALFFAMALSQENLSTWSSYKNIVLNTKASGAGVTTTQTKFPVLIRLTADNADVFNGALANGADVRFTNSAGKSIPYQIEQWDKTNKAAAIWVLVDTIKGSDSSASVKMYWGKIGAADSSKGTMVFDTANGFQSVWHLNDTGTTAKDATKNGFSALAQQVGTTGLPKDTVGMIGQSKKFNGNSGITAGSYYNIQNSASSKLNFLQGTNYSISAWVYCEIPDNNFRMIVCKNDNQYTLSTKSSNGCNWEFNTFASDGWEDVFTPATGNQWVHVVGVRNGTVSPATEFLYVNGALAKNTITVNSGSGGQVTTTNVFIGAMPGSPAQRYWAGRLDEVQMSNMVRGADWIKLSYQNQKAAQSLVVLGATQTNGTLVRYGKGNYSVSPALVTLRVPGSAPVAFEKPAGSFSKVALHVMDARGRVIWSKTMDLSEGNSVETAWNGKSDSGVRAGSGMYIARMDFLKGSLGSTGSINKKLTLF
jgi:hypothetical protein